MRERVEELERGDFKNNTPKIDISTPLIEISLNVDEDYEGSFSLKSLNSYRMKGVVYTSTYRMQCINPQFIGKEAKIKFVFHGKGICEGEILRGYFNIVSNGGELSLPFVVYIQKKVMLSSMGKINNLFHFTNLATKSWNEAYKLFQLPEFKNIFINNDKKYENLYLALTSGEMITEQCMEEFLIGISKKSAIDIEVNQLEHKFFHLSSDEKEMIQISKSTWGYVRIKVVAEGDFIELSNNDITTNDFIGSSYNLEYIIKKNKLHSGRNYGQIKLSTVNKEIVYQIVASTNGEDEIRKERLEARLKKECLLELVKLYTSYRCKKMNTNPWVKECMDYVNKLRNIEPNNRYYKLLKAQLLFIEKKNYEAHDLLEEFDFKKREMDEDASILAYYLYLTTFWNKDRRYTDKTIEEVKHLYSKNRNNWKILWILLYLDPYFRDNVPYKLNRIEEQYFTGCESPIMYVEAYRIIKADSFLLTKLGRFELQVIWWAVRNKVLSRDVSLQVANLATKVKEFNNILFKILSYSYEQFQDKEILSSICGLLIKGNRIATRYFKWYSLGVERDIQITRLYEYYMYSIPMNYEGNIPRPVLMYFGYNNNLDYKKSALLYERVIKQRDVLPELFQNYRRFIEEFILDQLMLKRNNDKLAFIYDTMLSLNIITPSLAKAISGIIFGCELYCNNSKIKSVAVIHNHLKNEKIYPIVDNKAYINIFTKDYAITFLDNDGNRYLLSVDYQLKNLMDEAYYVKKCYEKSTDSIDIKFNICQNLIDSNNITQEHLELLLELIGEPRIKESYKVILKNTIIKYCFDHYEDDDLIEYVTALDLGQIDSAQRSKAIEFLIMKGLYDKAFDEIKKYGYEEIAIKQLVKLTSRLIYQHDFEGDEILLSLSKHVFQHKKYDEIILKYLVENFSGSVNEMRSIWSAAYKFDIDSYEISERLILQVLFTNSYVEEIDEIFEYYYTRGSRFHIAQAFLTYHAYNYLVYDKMVGDTIFKYIGREQQNEGLQNDTSKLAMLKYYSNKKPLTTKEEDYVITTIKEFIDKKIYFKFYEQFDERIMKPYCYDGKYIVEYKTEKDKEVFIHYIQEDFTGDGEYRIEGMEQTYPGIYNKMFTLFYGDKVEYYITEADSADNLVKSNIIAKNEIDLNSSQSRYNILNDMTVADEMQDDKTLLELMRKYAQNSYAVEKLFKSI